MSGKPSLASRLPDILGWIAFSLPLLFFGYAIAFGWLVHELIGVSWVDVSVGAIIAVAAAIALRLFARFAAASLMQLWHQGRN